MMEIHPKKSLAIFSLTSCGDCFGVLKNVDWGRFSPERSVLTKLELQNFYDIDDLRGKNKIEKKYDIVIIEGHPRGKRQTDFAKLIRRQAKIVVAIGACAHQGGVYAKTNEPILKKIIRVDHTVPGCPVDRNELSRFLMDLFWGKVPRLPDLSVCFECRQNENDCLLKKGKLCLGPITRGGCDSICNNYGEACLGCRGLKPDANVEKMTEILKSITPEQDIEKMMTIFGTLKE